MVFTCTGVVYLPGVSHCYCSELTIHLYYVVLMVFTCTGVVYLPGEPLLLQSVGNTFILRCVDGLYIDANDRHISAAIYRSVTLK